MQLESYAKTDTGRIRPSNQDAVGCFPEAGLFVVADGMGGHESGEIASRLAVEGLRDYFTEHPSGKQEDRLLEAIRITNEKIFTAGRPEGRASARPMGTTLVALSLSPGGKRVHWAHVGDSRLYRYRKDELELLTADHTVYGNRLRGGKEIPLELPHTNELLAAMGVEATVKPSSQGDSWVTGDIYLLCSDGISGLIGPEKIREELASGKSCATIGNRLVRQALDAGGTDNASVVVLREG